MNVFVKWFSYLLAFDCSNSWISIKYIYSLVAKQTIDESMLIQ
jgi:hypothetical protein